MNEEQEKKEILISGLVASFFISFLSSLILVLALANRVYPYWLVLKTGIFLSVCATVSYALVVFLYMGARKRSFLAWILLSVGFSVNVLWPLVYKPANWEVSAVIVVCLILIELVVVVLFLRKRGGDT